MDDPATELGEDGDSNVRTERRALSQLAQNGIVVRGGGSSVVQLAGRLEAGAPSVGAAARTFTERNADALRVQATDLSTTMPPGRRTAHRTPVMYDKKTGTYKFTRISYGQVRDGIPVHDARIDVLVRNEPGNPVVLATSDARNLGSFRPTLGGVTVNAAKVRSAIALQAKTEDFVGRIRGQMAANLDQFSTPEPVIWAGTRAAPAAPRMAVSYIAESSTGPEKFRVVADAETGDVLTHESLVVFETVGGGVEGNVTLDAKSLECSTAGTGVMPYARIDHGAESALADASGVYSFDAPAGVPLDVNSPIAGEFFVVSDGTATRNEVLSTEVTPPAMASFVHIAANTGEFVLAQVNGYVHANQVRDWLLDYHPDYPTIATQTEFPVKVNLTGGYCPGNAWYDFSSINFCSSSSAYGNTSSASVNHHEYGHHIVTSGGSGQGAYGEGMSDTVAMLLADDPGLGYGFYREQCDTPLRTADNTCQYSASSCSSCGGESHACGNLLSGSVWDIRQALDGTDPQNALSIVTNLALNSVLLHSGTGITPQIATDFLVLDDDDGNIGNGTPHRSAICAGFEAHGIECPALETGLSVSPISAFSSASEDEGGPFVPAASTYTLENRGPSALDFAVSTDVSWIDIDIANGSLAVGATQDILISVNSSEASSLPIGTYTGVIVFDDVTGTGQDVTVPVELKVGTPTVKYSWNLTTDPGWERQGLWAYGVPLGLGGTYPDPTSGYTGENVLGYNLAGAYEANLPEMHLTSGAIDCSNLSQVTLRFRRWLNIESNLYDNASVSVSNDLTNWNTLWSNGGGTLSEQQWTLQELDLSPFADGSPTVYIRFTMGTTDGVVQYGGWNIDDIEIVGFGEASAECELDEDCDDDAFCNGTETCNQGACSGGTPIVCDDGVSCTVDQCNESTDSCETVIDHDLCGDGVFCNGIEQCTLSGCEAGTPTICEDGISCTVDTCDLATDSCLFSPDDAVCDNGVYCDGAEICESALGCQSADAPCPAGSCDEATNACLCSDVTYEAEAMFKSTGGSTSGGWNIWSNGYIQTSHDFTGGSTTVRVIASGDLADGPPHMVVSVGGQVVGEVFVESTTWQPYEFVFDADAGTQDVRVAFDNDYNGPLGDRNLKVDAVVVVCGSDGGESCTDDLQNGDETDVDCGGSCSPCDEGEGCVIDADCSIGTCEAGICTVETGPSCNDDAQNGDETDVDCGGSCSPCDEGEGCVIDADCSVGTCEAGICTVETGPSCNDGVENGDETDVDCGGSCSPCDEGEGCAIDADCSIGSCQAGICTQDSTGDFAASIRIDNDWGGGYCATIIMDNGASTATSSWDVSVNLQGTVTSNGWNAVFSTTTEGFDVAPLSWNAVIQPGGQGTQVGFCASRPSGNALPIVSAASATY